VLLRRKMGRSTSGGKSRSGGRGWAAGRVGGQAAVAGTWADGFVPMPSWERDHWWWGGGTEGRRHAKQGATGSTQRRSLQV